MVTKKPLGLTRFSDGVLLADLSHQTSFFDFFMDEPEPISSIVNGVTVIDVVGSLYKFTLDEIYNAVLNAETEEIVFMFDTPGGEFLRTPELYSLIKSCGKKTLAYVSGMCCSGGYYLASACNKIIVSEASLIGSIGAISIVSKNDSESYHVFKSGKFKALGNGAEAITDEGKNHLQEKINQIAQQFYMAVSQGRGVSVEQIVETNADSYYVFNAPEWMYDAVMSPAEFKKELTDERF